MIDNRLLELISRYLKVNPSKISSDTKLKDIGAQDWQIIEMAMEFEAMFKINMDADKALSLEKVNDWEELFNNRL
jgi:acyl carrier protein